MILLLVSAIASCVFSQRFNCDKFGRCELYRDCDRYGRCETWTKDELKAQLVDCAEYTCTAGGETYEVSGITFTGQCTDPTNPEAVFSLAPGGVIKWPMPDNLREICRGLGYDGEGRIWSAIPHEDEFEDDTRYDYYLYQDDTDRLSRNHNVSTCNAAYLDEDATVWENWWTMKSWESWECIHYAETADCCGKDTWSGDCFMRKIPGNYYSPCKNGYIYGAYARCHDACGVVKANGVILRGRYEESDECFECCQRYFEDFGGCQNRSGTVRPSKEPTWHPSSSPTPPTSGCGAVDVNVVMIIVGIVIFLWN